MNTRGAIGLTMAVLVMVLTGCSATETAATDKAGGTGGQVTLRMANAYSSLAYEPAVADFVDRVNAVSGGALQIEMVSDFGNFAPDAEQQVVRAVAGGEVDLGWAGTRVFDTLGVRAFQALTAPLLVDTYPLQEAVITSELPGDMLPALDELGLTGLGVLAGGLRKPFSVDRPMVTLGDWSGVTFQAFRSNGQAAAIEALGATPTDLLPGALDTGLQNGSIHGFEKNLYIYQYNGMQNVAPYLAANVNLWPETAALFANSARYSELTTTQRAWLDRAADEAVAASSELADQDQALFAEFCDFGGRAASASPEDLASMENAVSSVYSILESDPATAAAIARIRELSGTAPSAAALDIPAGCTGPAPGASSPTTQGPDESQTSTAGVSTGLNGTYRWVLTADDIAASGVSGTEVADLQYYPGTVVFTVEGGAWGGSVERPGSATVDGDRVTFTWADGLVLVFHFAVEADGTLTLEPVQPMPGGDAFVWATQPWNIIQ